MADQRLPQERLQPALLDRLTDTEPDNQKPEPIHQRVMSTQRLREAVIRDLEDLFNTTQTDLFEGSDRFPGIRRSVVSFGIPAFTGNAASSFDAKDLEVAISNAIRFFEPRILSKSLKVRALDFAGLDHQNKIGIEISGLIWAQPMPLDLLLRTTINLEGGEIAIRDQRAATPSER